MIVQFDRVIAAMLAFSLGVILASPLAAEVSIDILYLEHQVERPPTLSNLTAPPRDQGIQGANLAVRDNSTTGRFLKHTYNFRSVIVRPHKDFVARALEAIDGRPKTYLVVNAPASSLLALADHPRMADRLIFNAGAPDNRLRDKDCRANVLHTSPSRAMLADALVQFLVKKRWIRVFLVVGTRSGDVALGNAFRTAIKKFRATIVADKTWPFDADLRRSAGAEIPVFTQGFSYDVLIVADETDDFGRYISYNTWSPRPIAGSHGLRPTAWDRVVEQWGAAQLQRRFRRQTKRAMNARDYATWAAVRVIGEAVTRTNSSDIKTVSAYIRSDKFKLAAFKGRPISFRSWNGQLRQPIPLVAPGAVVASAPIEGFLHQRTELDSLGLDQSESQCEFK
ncbi:MAG: ABC transporter substrate-binding protein [Hyphomicrobiaceae bacterium]